MTKPVISKVKQKTVIDIYDGISELLIEDNPEFLTINNISKRSGYSIGNIYHHFKNIDEVIEKFVLDRIEKRGLIILDFIKNAPPTITAKELILFINNENFELLAKRLPKVVFLFLVSKLFDQPSVKEKFKEINSNQATAIEAMINRNETNTFNKLSYDEIEMALQMCSIAARAPIMLGYKLALTKSHQDMTLAILITLFAK